MPPVYKSISVKSYHDGKSSLELYKAEIEYPIMFKYVCDVIPSEVCNKIYDMLGGLSSPSLEDFLACPLNYHTYIGSFGRVTSPKRKTYAIVPERSFYRYKGKDLKVHKQPLLESVITLIKPYLDPTFQFDAVIFNGYTYNNTDNISLHIDDEKFLQRGNYPSLTMDESIVCTITILAQPELAMQYNCANPNDINNGCSVLPRNGSILYQGAILHEVPKMHKSTLLATDKVGRFSITLRKLARGQHPNNALCKKISCICNYGPSNYVYYNNSDCLL